MSRIFLFAIAVAIALLPNDILAAPSRINWDLSYEALLRQLPAREREYSAKWIAANPQRSTLMHISDYRGEPIEASALLEFPQLDGNSLGMWFITTRKGGQACVFGTSERELSCKPYDRAGVELMIRELKHYAMPEPPAPNLASTRGLFQYGAFMNILLDGVAEQRLVPQEISSSRQFNALLRRPTLSVAQADAEAARKQQADTVTALKKAGMNGDLAQLDRLIAAAPDQGKAILNGPGIALLEEAAQQGKRPFADWLLRHGVPMPGAGNRMLLAGSRTGDMSMIELLLANGAMLNPPRAAGADRSVLSEVASTGNHGLAEQLIRRGADVNFVGAACQTAHSLARSNESMQALLLRHGAQPDLNMRCAEEHRRIIEEDRIRRQIGSEVSRFLDREDYSGLEDYYRSIKEQRTASGIWMRAVFHGTLRLYAGVGRDPQSLLSREARIGEWSRQVPDSVLVRLYTVRLYIARAWAARQGGNGSMSQEDVQEAEKFAQRARQALEQCRELARAAGEPEWFRIAVAAYALTADDAAMRQVLEQTLATHPAYHDTYFDALFHLQQRRHGGADAIESLARRVMQVPGSSREGIYARIYWAADQFLYKGKLFAESRADWPTMRKSFEVLLADYPSGWNLTAYAYFACMANDDLTLLSALNQAAGRMEMGAWGNNGPRYEDCAARVLTVRPPARQAAAR